MTSADKRAASTVAVRNAAMQRQDAEKLLPGGFIREDGEEDSEEGADEDGDDVEEDTELEEEEGLPAPRETSVEQSHREFWDAKERLKTAVHIEHIKKYRDGRMSRDELAPTPDEIPTDSLQEESRDIILGGDYQLEMEVKGSLNSRMFLRQTMESTRRSFEIGLVEEVLEERLKKVAIDRDVTLFDVKVGYKLMAGSDKFRYTYIMSLDIEDGENLMAEVDKYRENAARNCGVRLVIQASYKATAVEKTSRKRSQSEAEITSSPVRSKSAGPITVGSSPPVAREKQDTYRTKQLKEKTEKRGQVYQVRGENQRTLVDRYTCIDTRCGNHPNYCWIEPVSRLHYAIYPAQLKRWSIAIESGIATLDNPPQEVVIYWLTKQKAVGASPAQNDRPTLKSLDERQSELAEKQVEMQIRQQELQFQRAQEDAEYRRQQMEERRREAEDRAEERRREQDDRRREAEDTRREKEEERSWQHKQRMQVRQLYEG